MSLLKPHKDGNVKDCDGNVAVCILTSLGEKVHIEGAVKKGTGDLNSVHSPVSCIEYHSSPCGHDGAVDTSLHIEMVGQLTFNESIVMTKCLIYNSLDSFMDVVQNSPND